MTTERSAKSLRDTQIELDKKHVMRLRALGLNWSAMAQRPFPLRPASFKSEIQGMKPKSFNQQMQLDTLQEYLDNPNRAGIFGVASSPNDGQAKLMAGWMMQYHLLIDHNNRPVWTDVHGQYGSEFLEHERVNCTLIVLNNLGPGNTVIKREKTRDILERYCDLPIIIVVNGSDPFTYVTRDLNKPMNGLLWLTSGIAKVHDI